MQLTRILSINVSLMRSKMFRPKPKMKFATSKPPSEFALEHFDFFYAPIFKSRWPSIRLGLLCEHKICALLNNYTRTDDDGVQKLKDHGAVELIDLLNQTSKKFRRRATTDKPNEYFDKSLGGDMDEQKIRRMPTANELDARDALNDFVQPTKKIERSPIDRNIIHTPIQPYRQPYMGPVDVDVELDDEINYPTSLRVLIFPKGSTNSFPASKTTADGVQNFYLLDAGTIFSVLALNVNMNNQVLDMCSSPGGTALAVLQTLLPSGLTCNEISSYRSNHARRTLNNFIPKSSSFRERIIMKRMDPSDDNVEWDELDKFDKVLVNVPSTNDRHSLIADRSDNMFRPALNAERLQLPDRQAKILKAGLRSLKKGGDLIYTTSSLSPIQNDAVVENVLREIQNERKIEIVIRNTNRLAALFDRAGVFKFYDGVRFGQLILPYLPSNFGPLYVCKMSRIK